MAFNKMGLNVSNLQNLSPPSYSDFNLSNNSIEIVNQIPQKANESVSYAGTSYLGLGIMVTMFFWLIFKLGNALELYNRPFSTIRSVGISAGVVSLFGVMMINIGYFTDFYHVIIFMGILLVSFIWIFLGSKG